MSVTFVLALILLVLMVVIGGKKGMGAFVSLWINFILLMGMLLLISWGFSMFMVLLIGSSLVLLITIYSAGADEETTMVSLKSSLIVMLILILVIIPVEHLNFVQGFTVENSEELEGLSLQIGLNFGQLGIAAALLATLGAIAEASVAITSGLSEIMEYHPDMEVNKLIRSGYQLGYQIIGTALNTVLFGFMADFLSLGIMFAKLNYGIGDIVNSKLLVSAILSMLYAFFGVIMVLPITLGLIKIHQLKVINSEN